MTDEIARPGHRAERRGRLDERGSATLLGVHLIGLLVVVTAVCVAIAALVVAHRRAQSAADLGALAGASALQQGQSPCGAAADVVARNAGRLVGCRTDGETVTIRVEVSTARIFGSVRRARADARAGPVGTELSLAPR